jgi:hypothetical protein
MSTEIERLLYSERQYLRSFDFTAEQSYHLEMRRRLNLALHLSGIVYGLELLQGEIVQGGPKQCFVSEGMAIDAYGREIIVSAKHLLSDDLDKNRITGTGPYAVWIRYTREPATPPEAAYQRCDLQGQYTRWREYFEIKVIGVGASPYPAGTNPHPADPDPLGDLPDDPEKFPWWLHLGTISVDPSLKIGNPTNEDRVYIGIRAQRIVAPRDATKEFQVLEANDSLNPLTSITVTDNLFLEQNLIAGEDFLVDQQKIQPPPITSPPSTFPNPTGNVKIASDLFLQGNLYTHCDPSQPDLWLNLDQCIRERILNSVPEIQIGTVPIQFSQVSVVDSSGTVSVPVDVPLTTQLAQVDTTAIITSIAKIHWKPSQAGVIDSPPSSPPTISSQLPRLASFSATTAPLTTGAASSTDGLQIDTYASKPSLVSGSNYTTTVTCTVAPPYQLLLSGTTMYDVPIDFVLISYVVIFYPKKT